MLQKIIDKFTTYATEGRQKKFIFVHNFQQFSTLDEVEKYIASDLILAFGCQKTTVNEKTFWVHTDKKSKAIFMHVVLASEGTVAGERWNPQTFKLIKEHIDGTFAFAKPPLLSAVSDTVESLLPQYFYEREVMRCPTYTGNKYLDYVTLSGKRLRKSWNQLRQVGFVKTILNMFRSNEGSDPFKVKLETEDKKHLLRLAEPRELILLPISETFPNGRFVPKFHTATDATSWHLRVDLPGVAESELKVKVVGSSLAVSGIRCDDVSHPGSLGEFSLVIEIPSVMDGEQVDRDNCKQTVANGVFSYSCPILKDGL